MIASNSSYIEKSKLKSRKRRRIGGVPSLDTVAAATDSSSSKKPPPPPGHNRNNHVDKKSKRNVNYHNEIKQPKQQQQLPLAGKLVAVTSLQSLNKDNDGNKNHSPSKCTSNTNDDDDDDDKTTTTYAQLVATCRKQAGADTTSQVHRKVYCLIATSAAIVNKTQRVRKAWKLNIPVVHVSWLYDCIQQGQLINFTTTTGSKNYLASAPPTPKCSTKAARIATANFEDKDTVASAKLKDDDDDVSAADNAAGGGAWSEEVDLGCCCVCHDNASPPTDCLWCVECSVNIAHAL